MALTRAPIRFAYRVNNALLGGNLNEQSTDV
jgi:hypothetical protein